MTTINFELQKALLVKKKFLEGNPRAQKYQAELDKEFTNNPETNLEIIRDKMAINLVKLNILKEKILGLNDEI